MYNVLDGLESLALNAYHLRLLDLANAWTVMLGFDIMIFGMTLYKSWTRNPMGNNIWLHIFLRDGSYFFHIIETD